jgi:FtsP/CotA-like multicopper oxidase with cupredoxin domain
LYNKTTGDPVDPNIPLETFHVQKGFKYRFRVICSSMTFAFRVSIDHHVLHVIATEAEELEEVLVESLVVQPGERYDFWIQTDDPLGTGLYWIGAETLEYQLNSEVYFLILIFAHS